MIGIAEYDSYRYDSYMSETVVTVKGTTTIPNEIRRALGIAPGTVLEWSTQGNVIEARKKPGVLNEIQQHIRRRAGSWKGKVSGKELLHRTRP
jgi:AbrB family looped-hinge helix DNA binding protein